METLSGEKEDYKCKECGLNTLRHIPQEGELVCDNCATVYKLGMSEETYEKRNFSSENSGGKIINSRISEPTTLSGSSLGTNLVTNVKGGGQKLKKSKKTSGITNVQRKMEEITTILRSAEVKDALIDETKDIFETVSKTQNIKGRNFKNLVGAIYFIASKRKNSAVTFKQIAQMIHLQEKDITKAFNYIKYVIVDNSTTNQLNDLKSYIRRFAESNESKVTNEVKQLAWNICENIINCSILDGRNPTTIAGISLMIANNLLQGKLTKNDIAQDFSTEATLDKVFQKIKNRLTDIVPEEYHDRISNLLSND